MVPKSATAASKSKIAAYLAKQIDALAGIKSQREIAAEMGYEKANIISMFKTGEVKIPLDKIPSLAKAISVDPAFLFKMAMEQYWPELNEAIGAIFGQIVTANQKKILARIIELSGEDDPEFTPDLDARLRKAFVKAAK